MVPTQPLTSRDRSSRSRRSLRLRTLVAALLLGLVAPLVAVSTPAEAAPVRHRTTAEVHIQWAVQALINSQRARHGLAPVHMNKKLQKAARRHNRRMAHHNQMSHKFSGERYFSGRISKVGYHWSWAGENIGWNSSMNKGGVLTLQRLMYNERAPYDGHRQNILNRKFRDVGVDVYFDRRHHKIWLTTDFGRKR